MFSSYASNPRRNYELHGAVPRYRKRYSLRRDTFLSMCSRSRTSPSCLYQDRFFVSELRAKPSRSVRYSVKMAGGPSHNWLSPCTSLPHICGWLCRTRIGKQSLGGASRVAYMGPGVVHGGIGIEVSMLARIADLSSFARFVGNLAIQRIYCARCLIRCYERSTS